MATLSFLRHEIYASSDHSYWLISCDDIIIVLGVRPQSSQLSARSAFAAAKMRS